MIVASREPDRADVDAEKIVLAVTDASASRALFERLGPVAHLVSTAGARASRPVRQLDLDAARHALEVKLRGPLAAIGRRSRGTAGIESSRADADTAPMLTVNKAIVLALAAVFAFAVWRYALPAEQQAADQAGDAAVSVLHTRTDARFTVAEANLQLHVQSTGSYAGAAMPEGATLVRADSGAYCVQVGPPGTVEHLAGPGGSPVGGPC